MSVLDVGCGAGAFTRFLAQAIEVGEVTELDNDDALLDRARRETRDLAGVAVRYEPGDARKRPYPDARSDLVASAFLLCVVPEALPLLAEMRRGSRPGGLIASLSCFCKSGILPWSEGQHALPGNGRLAELWRRFREVRRLHVRNPGLRLPNGRDLDVWADYGRAGLVDLRIHGYLTVFAPGDARWTDSEAREYTEGRLDEHPPFMEDLREHIVRKYDWLLESDERIRRGMEVLCEPAVLITGKVPGGSPGARAAADTPSARRKGL